MPLARRSHRKSKTGCVNCKKRRIKCDEGKPACRNCLQHRIKCHYSEPQTSWIHLPATSSDTPTPPTSQPRIPQSSQSPQPSMIDIDTTDFRLLHHFLTSTYRTLSDHPDLQSLWKDQIPELSFVHTYLLRMIIAVSALHLYSKTYDAHHLTYAYQQYEAALRASSLALAQISPANCDALYACSALGFVFELGSSHSHKSLLYDSNGSLATWTVHVRGVRTIIASSWQSLTSGVLKPIFHPQCRKEGLEDVEGRLEQLAEYVRSSIVDPEQLSVYTGTIGDLVKCLKMVEVAFFGWMCQTTDEYVGLLARKDPVALLIFAHSCVLLKYGELEYWINQWPKALLCEIYDCLDAEFRGCLDWPLEEFGLAGANDDDVHVQVE